jgi:hypothetical protein
MSSFVNGCSVSRFWHDGSGELLALFQYETDADAWAKSFPWRPHFDGDHYIVRANLGTGHVRMFIKSKPEVKP